MDVITQTSIDNFNKLGHGSMKLTLFQNDPYKAKIRTAIGAGQAPTLIYGWGGGILKSYVEAGHVEDLTGWLDKTEGLKDSFLPSTWGAATLDGKIYGVPFMSSQPIVMYYNAEVFDKVGANIPTTWDEMMGSLAAFNSKGVAPFSLGGQSKWTSMMWLEYLLDRIGGPEVFNAIYANQADSWSDPAVLTTCTKIQELVKENGFIKGFSSITSDTDADQAVLFTGKSAMMLHGAWKYGSMKAAKPDFVAKDLQMGSFFSVPGGKGDPLNIVGNPANYLSVNAKAPEAEKAVGRAYLHKGLFAEVDVKSMVAAGQLPVVNSAQPMLQGSEDEKFLQAAYDLVAKAPNFQQSWDQALSPTQSETLLTNIDKLFLLQISPEQFATAMNETIGK